MLKIGIVGLPNVGKSTLFNVLTKAKVLAANYPFATIEPNTGIVPVPDGRLSVLSEMYHSAPIVPATVQFVDIAGLVAGASKGEGLGNKFLAHIRECDAIVQVVRAFDDSNVLHVAGDADPKRDIEIINTELELADLESVERAKSKKGKDPVPDDLPLLMKKPVIYAFNVDEKVLLDVVRKKELADMVAPARAVFISAKIEEEMSELSESERKEFLSSYGIDSSGLELLIAAAYETLGLQSFLTAGDKEVRAWAVKRGATAPEAAGVIHTDFKKGFIAAQVMNYDDLVRLGSESVVKAAGLVRTEGKDYLMQPGDVVEFRFNV